LRKDYSIVARDWRANGHHCPGFTGLGSCACFREAREVSARAMVINPMVCTKVHPPVVSNLGQQSQRLLAASDVPEGITQA